MSNEKKLCSGGCNCGAEVKLIYPCSGAADVGDLSDRVGRKLAKSGLGKMSCLAGIGGGVSGLIESAKSASKILAIDGCPVMCAKKTLEAKGISDFAHVTITELGFSKGETDVNDMAINTVMKKCQELI